MGQMLILYFQKVMEYLVAAPGLSYNNRCSQDTNRGKCTGSPPTGQDRPDYSRGKMESSVRVPKSSGVTYSGRTPRLPSTILKVVLHNSHSIPPKLKVS